MYYKARQPRRHKDSYPITNNMIDFIFDDYETEKNYWIGSTLNIGLYSYKVLGINKTRVKCQRLGLVN